MREIKFRGLDCNGKWQIGTYYFGCVYPNSHSAHYINDVEVDPGTIGEYINLFDMNKKQLCEGDDVRILYTDWPSKSHDNISLEDYKKSISKYGVVTFYDYEWGLEIYCGLGNGTYSDSLSYGKYGEIEIIGNIHEN